MTFATVLQRLTQLDNPYPGLRPFETSEAHLFFGRDQQVLDLCDRLTRNRFVAVLGLSGSGKSSLVRAGLIPALERGRLLEPGRTWRIAQARPSGTPFANLAVALDCQPTDLRSSSHALIQLAGNEQPLLVLIDQFEELFRYKERIAGDSATPSEAAAFISLLLASSRSSLPIYVVITMRTDYLGDCAEFPEFPEALNESQYLVPRLTREQRRQAIEGPLGRVQISSSLVEQILNDAGDEPDQLPILQHALMRTWSNWRKSSPENERSIDSDDYQAIGGFAGALNQHANELLQSAADPQFAEIIFKRLTALGRGNRERRDPAHLSELWELCTAVSPEKRQRVNEVIDVFRQGEGTFLAPREGELRAETYIDIAHESLIRHWRLLAETWLPEEEKQAKTLIELLDRARGWQAGTRDLLVGLDLSSALDWKSHINPSPKWAEHYAGPGAIDEVESFLSASHKKFEDDQQREHERLERELTTEKQLRETAERKEKAISSSARTFKIFCFVLATLLLCAVALAYVAWRYTGLAREQGKVAKSQRWLAYSRQLAAEAEKLIYYGNRGVGLDRAIQAFSIAKSSEARQAVADAFPQELTRLEDSNPVYSAAFSPDGQRVLTTSGNTASIWDATSGQLIRKLQGHRGNVYAAAFSPDGQRVVTGSRDQTARIWNAATGRIIRTLKGGRGYVDSVEFSHDGRSVVTAGWDGVAAVAQVWDAASGHVTANLKGHSTVVHSASFSPNGLQVVTASWDGTACLWDAATGRKIRTFDSHSGRLSKASFSADGRFVVTAGSDGVARVWNATTASIIKNLAGYSAYLEDAEFSPDGRRILTASDDSAARVWDLSTGQVIANLQGHSSYISTAAFSPDGQRVVTASDDKTARVWNTAAAAEVVAKLTGHSDKVYAAVFSPDGQSVVTGSSDQTACVWNAATGELQVLAKGNGEVNSVDFSTDGRVVTGSSDNLAQVRSAATLEVLTQLAGHSAAVNVAVFSPDGLRVATGSSDRTVRLWNSATGQEVAGLGLRHSGAVQGLSFARDGKRLVTAGDDHEARVWNATTGKLLTKLIGHSGPVWSVAFSPDGLQVVTASDDGTIRLWNASDGKVTATLRSQSGAVFSAVFSPDGKRLITGSFDKTARVWDAATGQVMAKLEGHSDSVLNSAFSPDGDRVVTAGADGTALIWRILTLDEISRFLASK